MQIITLLTLLVGTPGFDGVLHVEISQDSKPPMEGTFFISSKGNMRVDTKAPNVPNGTVSMIFGPRHKDALIQVIHAEKKYMKLPVKDAPEDLGKGHERAYKIERVGEARVAGLKTTHVRVTDEASGAVSELWVAPDIPWSDALKHLSRNRPDGGTTALVEALRKKGVKGYPLRMVQKKGSHTLKVETTKVERKKLPSSTFAIPKGYALIKMPSVPQLAGAGGKELTPEQLRQITERLKQMKEQQQRAQP